MDADRFDALSKTIMAGLGRRRMLAALLGGPLASLLGSLETEARPKQRQRKGHGQAHERRQDGGGASGHLAEAKRKIRGKKRHKKPKSPPPLPPGCQNCNACQMCQDGACVPDPALGGVPCLGSGPTCSHCLNGVCTVNEQRPCDDGICVRRGTCCPGEKYCSDPESSTGFACVGQTDCCPPQRKCSDGTCGTNTRCCPNERKCDGICYAQGECCPNERKCPGGVCVSAGACCPSETGAHFCPPTPQHPQGVCCAPPFALPCPIFVSCAGCQGHDLCCNWTHC